MKVQVGLTISKIGFVCQKLKKDILHQEYTNNYEVI